MNNKGEFLHRLQANTGLMDRDEAEKVTKSVMMALSGRLTAQEASHVEAQLPQDLKPLWRGNVLQEALGKLTGQTDIELDELIQQVCKDTGVSQDRARELTRAVFHLIKEQITAGEAADVLAQLPKKLKVAWLEA